MNRYATACLVAALGLYGCQQKTVDEMGYSERQKLAQEIVDRCVEQGFKPGTPQIHPCLSVETQAEIARREHQRQLENATVRCRSFNSFNTVITRCR